jgi:hypothetical protein
LWQWLVAHAGILQ